MSVSAEYKRLSDQLATKYTLRQPAGVTEENEYITRCSRLFEGKNWKNFVCSALNERGNKVRLDLRKAFTNYAKALDDYNSAVAKIARMDERAKQLEKVEDALGRGEAAAGLAISETREELTALRRQIQTFYQDITSENIEASKVNPAVIEQLQKEYKKKMTDLDDLRKEKSVIGVERDEKQKKVEKLQEDISFMENEVIPKLAGNLEDLEKEVEAQVNFFENKKTETAVGEKIPVRQAFREEIQGFTTPRPTPFTLPLQGPPPLQVAEWKTSEAGKTWYNAIGNIDKRRIQGRQGLGVPLVLKDDQVETLAKDGISLDDFSKAVQTSGDQQSAYKMLTQK